MLVKLSKTRLPPSGSQPMHGPHSQEVACKISLLCTHRLPSHQEGMAQSFQHVSADYVNTEREYVVVCGLQPNHQNAKESETYLVVSTLCYAGSTSSTHFKFQTTRRSSTRKAPDCLYRDDLKGLIQDHWFSTWHIQLCCRQQWRNVR